MITSKECCIIYLSVSFLPHLPVLLIVSVHFVSSIDFFPEVQCLYSFYVCWQNCDIMLSDNLLFHFIRQIFLCNHKIKFNFLEEFVNRVLGFFCFFFHHWSSCIIDFCMIYWFIFTFQDQPRVHWNYYAIIFTVRVNFKSIIYSRTWWNALVLFCWNFVARKENYLFIKLAVVPIMTSRKMKSRDEIRKEKELEEARKRGTIPAEVDEEGRYALAIHSISALSQLYLIIFFYLWK